MNHANEEDIKLILWTFLHKLKIIDFKKESISHFAIISATFNNRPSAIPSGAFILPISSVNLEYIIPCKIGEGNWP